MKDTPESVDCENVDSEPKHSGPLEVVKSAVAQPAVAQPLAQPAVAQPVAQSVAQSPVQPLSSSAGCSEELIQPTEDCISLPLLEQTVCTAQPQPQHP